jgi:hypothetical protein
MFQNETVRDTDVIKFNQEASQTELDMNELYKWLERPITEEDEEYRDE